MVKTTTYKRTNEKNLAIHPSVRSFYCFDDEEEDSYIKEEQICMLEIIIAYTISIFNNIIVPVITIFFGLFMFLGVASFLIALPIEIFFGYDIFSFLR